MRSPQVRTFSPNADFGEQFAPRLDIHVYLAGSVADATAASGMLLRVDSGELVYGNPAAYSDVRFAGQVLSFGDFAEDGLAVLMSGKWVCSRACWRY